MPATGDLKNFFAELFLFRGLSSCLSMQESLAVQTSSLSHSERLAFIVKFVTRCRRSVCHCCVVGEQTFLPSCAYWGSFLNVDFTVKSNLQEAKRAPKECASC